MPVILNEIVSATVVGRHANHRVQRALVIAADRGRHPALRQRGPRRSLDAERRRRRPRYSSHAARSPLISNRPEGCLVTSLELRSRLEPRTRSVPDATSSAGR